MSLGALHALLRQSHKLRADPREFAPDILRLHATPPHPLPRLVLKVCLALLGVALLWAAVGRLDIVAVAQGKLVPQSYVKIVQPAEAGIVKEILVREGERVKAGQVLMRMDTTLSAADQVALRNEYQQKSLALRRIDAELADKPMTRETGDASGAFAQVEAQYQANRRALEAAIAQERAARDKARQEMAAARETRDKLEKVLPHYQEQDEAYRKLVKDGFAGRLMGNDKTRERIEKEQDLKTQAFIMAREQANMTQSDRKIAQLRSDYQRNLRTERADVAERAEKLRQELAKQDHRLGLMELKAPQDGLVKDLATHTTGTVAQPGTILLTLVPAAEALRGEVWLSNEDVGFVREGQEVKLKFAAFQFQKYGMLGGRVEHVAADAAENQDATAGANGRKLQAQPLVYRTFIALDAQRLSADGVSYRLSPGMQVNAEIKLGERTILEYLLSPVQKAFHEAGRER